MKLVVNSNTNTCHIYHYTRSPAELTLLKAIDHPENKLKNGDLTSDRPGHYQGGESARGAYEPHMEARAVLIDNFAREIARELEQERINNNVTALIIIAPAQMYGQIAKHLNKNVKDLITNKIEKDFLNSSAKELLDYLQNNTQFPDQK